MQTSLRWLRIYLGVAGATAFFNILFVAGLRNTEKPPAYAVVLTLLFATFSVFCGLLMLLGCWLLPRLIKTAPRFIRGVILLRYLLVLVERIPPAAGGDYLSISLVLVWTGMTFFMHRMAGELSRNTRSIRPA